MFPGAQTHLESVVSSLHSLAPRTRLPVLEVLAIEGLKLNPPITTVEGWSLAFQDQEQAIAWARKRELSEEQVSALAALVVAARPFEDAAMAVHGARLVQEIQRIAIEAVLIRGRVPLRQSYLEPTKRHQAKLQNTSG